MSTNDDNKDNNTELMEWLQQTHKKLYTVRDGVLD
jgi:hypothetical protein